MYLRNRNVTRPSGEVTAVCIRLTISLNEVIPLMRSDTTSFPLCFTVAKIMSVESIVAISCVLFDNTKVYLAMGDIFAQLCKSYQKPG